mgnify:CR=1 FL=1
MAEITPDGSASRSYYAAYHAVSALFFLEGREFSKHGAVRSAVHRDLVKQERWAEELGKSYDVLWNRRDWGDYGGLRHVTTEEAADAIERASRILEAVRTEHPELDAPSKDVP